MARRCYDEFRYCSWAGKDCSTRDSSDEEPLDWHRECAPTGGSNAWRSRSASNLCVLIGWQMYAINSQHAPLLLFGDN